MKKVFRFLVLCLVTAGLLTQLLYIPKAEAAQEGRSLTILFTHDMHDNLLPFKLNQDGTEVNVGGYARLESAIQSEKAKDSNALVVDGGDYSMGTPFQTIYTSQSPELRIMGQMGYDVVTFGNHEFDYRASGLAESLNAAAASGDKLPFIVESNATFPTDKNKNMTSTLAELKKAMDNYGVKDYTVIERNGIKIGIFGVMGADSASNAPMSEVVFTDEVKQAQRVVKILKEQEKVDFIICLSHSGTWTDKKVSEDELLAKKVPEINVIISGHTHTKLEQPIIKGNTVIGSAGENGEFLGTMQLTGQSDGSFKLNSYKLIPINDSLPKEPDTAKLVGDFKNAVQKEYFDKFGLSYDEVIAEAPFNFPPKSAMEAKDDESTLGNLISDAYIYAVKQAEGNAYETVDAAIVPIGTIRGSFLKGPITTAEAYSISSLGVGPDKMSGYPLISVYLTGKELKTLCEVDASVSPIMGDAQLYVSGLKFSFNPSRLIFNKVLKVSLVKPEGAMIAAEGDSLVKIDDKKLYRVVAGLYSAQMLSVVGDKSYGLLKLQPKTKDGKPVTDYEAQIVYSNDGGNKTEVKEWSAIVTYLKSFDKVNGVPEIPQYYSEVQGRKVSVDNKNIFALLSHPNHIALAVYGIVLVLTALIIWVIIMIVRKVRRRKLHKKS